MPFIGIIIRLSLESYDYYDSSDLIRPEIFLILIFLKYIIIVLFILNKYKFKTNNIKNIDSDNKKNSRLKTIWKRIITQIYSRKFWLRVISVFLIGISLRCLILHLYDINVFTDMFNRISLFYYGFMVLLNELLLEILGGANSVNGLTFYMIGPNQGTGGNPVSTSNISNNPVPESQSTSEGAPVANQGAATGGPANQGAAPGTGRSVTSVSNLVNEQDNNADFILGPEEVRMGLVKRNDGLYNRKNIKVHPESWGYSKPVASNSNNGPAHIFGSGPFNPRDVLQTRCRLAWFAGFLDKEDTVRLKTTLAKNVFTTQDAEYLTRAIKHYYGPEYASIQNNGNVNWVGEIFPLTQLENNAELRSRLRDFNRIKQD